MNARAVPIGTHFAINDCTTGITPAEFVYMGTQTMTAIGTAKGLLLVMYVSKNPVGINQWMAPPTATHNKTYGIIFHIKAKESSLICLRKLVNFTFICCIFASVELLAFKIKSAT